MLICMAKNVILIEKFIKSGVAWVRIWPPGLLSFYIPICVHVFTIICMYISKRQFCQIEAMKMRDPDRKMSLHAL